MSCLRVLLTSIVTLLAFVAHPSLPIHAQDRHAVPSEDVQAEARKLAAELFKEDYEKAKSAADKLKLSDTLFKFANESEDDPTARYVALKLSRDVAIAAGGIDQTLRAVDAVEGSFQVDRLNERSTALARLAKTASGRDDSRKVTGEMLKLTDPLLDEDRFDLLVPLMKVAVSSARFKQDVRDMGSASEALMRIRPVSFEYREEVGGAQGELEYGLRYPDAAGRYLEHLAAAWHALHGDAPLAEQHVVLTVPASFDAISNTRVIAGSSSAALW